MTVGDPKPALRVADREAGIEKLRREGACRACGHKSWMLNRHHLVSRGQRGDDIDANIIPLCGSGTTGCHGAMHDHGIVSWPSKFEGYEWQVVASAIRAKLRPEELRYILRKKNEDWLLRTYPKWDR